MAALEDPGAPTVGGARRRNAAAPGVGGAREPGAADIGRFEVWLLATRPKTLLAAVAPVVVGTGFAVARGGFALLPAVAALVGALLIQIATNLANDYYDFVRGGDTAERVGPLRVTQAGLIEPAAVRRGMILTLLLAFLVGVYLVWVGGWPVVVIGVASLICAVAYTGGPFPLAYHGLGDLFVFVFFGLVAVGGTYYVQALDFRTELLLAGAAIGALNTAILVVNNLRDLGTDARAGKRTLAVRLGRQGTRVEYCGLLLLAFAAPLVGMRLHGWTPWTLLTWLALIPALAPIRRVLAQEDPRELVPALAATARVTAVYGLLLAAGINVG